MSEVPVYTEAGMADAGAEAPMPDEVGDGLILTLEASFPVESPVSMTLEAPIPEVQIIFSCFMYFHILF